MSLSFDNLKSDAGLKQLDAYLQGRTFVFGCGPSTADSDLVALVGSAPDAKKYPAAARWYSYITSFNTNEQKGFAKTILSVGTGSAAASKEEAGDDSDDDLFGDDSDEEDVDLDALAKANAAAKAKKKKAEPVLRSQIIFDIKPCDTEVDLEDMAEKIKEIEAAKLDNIAAKMKAFNDDRVTAENVCDWGEGHEVVPIAFGICKLQISCCVIDEILGTDDIIDIIEGEFGEQIQSIDVAAFNKANALK